MHYHIACESWAGKSCNELLHRLAAVGTELPHCPQALWWGATMLGGSGRWNSCNAPPHYLGAVGSINPIMHCHTACGQWVVEFLQCIDNATPPRGGGQWNQGNAPPHYPGAVGGGTVQCAAPLPHCRGALGVELLQCGATLLGDSGDGPPAMHHHTAWGRGQWICCNALRNCLGATGRGTAAKHCLGALGIGITQCIARLPRGTR